MRTHRTLTLALLVATVITVAACDAETPEGVNDVAATPAAGGGARPGSPDDATSTPRTYDWNDTGAVVEVIDGWTLRDCDGDAPVRCLHAPDGPIRGTIELVTFPGDLAAEDGAAAVREALHRRAQLDWLEADRQETCGLEHRVEVAPLEDTEVDGYPAVLRAFTTVAGDGAVVEAEVGLLIGTGEDLSVLTLAAAAPDGCMASDLALLTPAELELLRDPILTLLRASPLPRA